MLSRIKRAFVESYFSLSLDALGLFRFAFGLTQLCDLARRWPSIELLYSNTGVLSNHYLLFRPPSEFFFSPLIACSTPHEVQAYFLVLAVCLTLFTLGFRTKLFHIICAIGMIGVHNRNILVEYGGDVVANIFWVTTLLLPLGKRCSLDALRAPKETNGTHYHVSIACTLCIFQLAAIYFLNAFNKSGATWDDGSAIYYTLHQERMVSLLGTWALEHVPYRLLELLTWSVRPLEYVASVLILVPFRRRIFRSSAVLMLWALHLGMMLFLDLGVFSVVMMAALVLLLDASIAAPAAQKIQSVMERFFSSLQLPPSPIAANSGPARSQFIREALGAILFYCLLTQLCEDNRIAKQNLGLSQPAWVRPIVGYPRLFEGWSLFAPDAPTSDGRLVIDLTLRSGEHFDPQTGAAPNVESVRDKRIPWTQGWDSYSLRISFSHFATYRFELERWIRERGRGLYPFSPQEVAAYKVSWISTTSVPPLSGAPGLIRKDILLEGALPSPPPD